jgi:hypothetical protein
MSFEQRSEAAGKSYRARLCRYYFYKRDNPEAAAREFINRIKQRVSLAFKHHPQIFSGEFIAMQHKTRRGINVTFAPFRTSARLL